MARRRSSARRSAGNATSTSSSSSSGRRSARAGAAAGGGTGLKPGRDGKYEISCPQCATVYKMPEAALEQKFTCRNCSRTFFPKSTGGRRNSAAVRKADTKPFIIGGVLLVGLIVVGVVISSLSGPDKNANASRRAEGPPPPPTGESNARVKVGMDWMAALASDDPFRFANAADMQAMKARFDVWPDRNWPSVKAHEYTDLAKAILAAMANDEDAAPLLKLNPPITGSIPESEALADAGQVTISWNIAKQEGYVADRGEIVLDYRMIDGAPRIHGWTWAPKPRGAKRKDVVNAKSGAGPAHELIEKPVEVEREIGGEMHKIAESPIIALDHLEDTPAELRTKIDDLVELLLDHSDGRNFNRAVDALKKIGRPAIPRLLNKINDLHGDLDGNNIKLSQVVRCLRVMTGASYGYPVADNNPMNPGVKKTEAERLSSLRAWFAFWYSYHKGEFDVLIQKDDAELEAEFLGGSSKKDPSKK